MKIHDLSEADLSLWICHALEPKPSGKYWREVCSASDMSTAALESGAHSEVIYKDMVNDPAMTLMLMEKLLLEREYKQVLLDVMHGSKLGRAVAEAWAMAHGWTGEEPK